MILRAGKPKRKNSPAGFTLIEILVVVAIIAVMMGLAATLVGSSFQFKAKGEARRLIGAIRYAYNEAVSKNLYCRLVFDFEKQSYWLEASDSPLLIGSDAEPASSSVSSSEEKGEEKGEETENQTVGFTVLEEGPIKTVKLPEEVRLKEVFVSHQEKALSEGTAYLYFFPRGFTEQALIHFSDEDDKSFYSILVEPLTGRCQAKAEYVEYTSIIQK